MLKCNMVFAYKEWMLMRKSKYTEELVALVAEVCRKMGFTEQNFYRWKNKYSECSRRHETATTV